MAESRIKDENYYMIQGFMINKLGLKGVPLSVYAIIYGFSQDGETEFTGSLQYLCDFTGGTSKPTIIKALKELVESGYILRREERINGVQFNRYKANLPLLKKFNGVCNNFDSRVVNNFKQGSKETLPNIIGNNDISLNNNITAEFETLWALYPRKAGKARALKEYEKARKNGAAFEDIKQGICNYNKQIEAKQTPLEFIKHGSTWFANKCWFDDYDYTPAANGIKKVGVNGIVINTAEIDDFGGAL